MMEQQTENSTVQAEETTTPGPVLPGIALREARERLGLSVADAAAQTKLAPRQIEALEAGDYQQLPELAFVRGFVRSYAKILQLDVQPLLDALPKIGDSPVHVTPDSVEVPFPDAHSQRLQNLIWLGAALLLSVVVVAFAVYHYTTPRSQVEPEETAALETVVALPAGMALIPASAVDEAPASSVAAPAVVAETQPVPPAKLAVEPPAVKPVDKPVPPVAKPQPEIKPAQPVAKPQPDVKPVQSDAAPAAKPVQVPSSPAVATSPAVAPAASQSGTLRLTFGEESWTEVRDKNGNIVSSQLNPAGSELRLSGQGPYSLVVGRASSARLTYKGKTIDLKPNTNATSDVARVTLE